MLLGGTATAGHPGLLGPAERHLVSRFSYGLTPRLAADVRRAGGSRRWFAAQLQPALIADGKADQLTGWWPSLNQGAQRLWENSKGGVAGGFQVMLDYQRYCLARRIFSERQVLEVMTEFWENLLNVPTNGEPSFVHRRTYGDAIRANAFGSYEQLLYDAVTHPAMLVYLDNATSTRTHPNENLGRELLELHTVGRGNFEESQVKDSARILTGWRVETQAGNQNPTWEAFYEPSDHWTGPVSVLQFSEPNADRDGRDLTRRYLSYLARHERTAERIVLKLATKFVRDNPGQALLDRLKAVYLENDTHIVPVLLAMIESPEFAGAADAKVRDPGEDLAATYRLLEVSLAPPVSETSAANSMLWQAGAMGLTPFNWPRPDGAPTDNASWSSPARMLASFNTHFTMSGGYWPKVGATYPRESSWVPHLPIRFDHLVEHVSQQILHRHSTGNLLKACCRATDRDPMDTIARGDGFLDWGIPLILNAVLDSPAHFHR